LQRIARDRCGEINRACASTASTTSSVAERASHPSHVSHRGANLASVHRAR